MEMERPEDKIDRECMTLKCDKCDNMVCWYRIHQADTEKK